MISHRGEEGFSSCSAHPCHHAVVTTPPEELGASVCFAGFCCLHSKAQKLDLRILISRLLHVRCCYSLMTRDHPFDGLVGRLQGLGLPPPCYPSYGAPTLTPVGLTPTEWASLPLDAQACSAFTCVTACTLVLPPYFVARIPKASTVSLPPQLLRLLPAGASRRVGLAPTGKAPPFHGARQ
jgi:hypothetical protein